MVVELCSFYIMFLKEVFKKVVFYNKKSLFVISGKKEDPINRLRAQLLETSSYENIYIYIYIPVSSFWAVRNCEGTSW